jgi:hypothetical protein
MLKASSGLDSLARSMATNIGDAMGGCNQTSAQFTQFIVDQFAAHNVVGAPVDRTLAFSTAYQATDPTKPAFIKVILRVTLSIAIGSATNTVEVVQGPTSAVAGGTGSKTDTFRNDLSVTLITIGLTGEQSVNVLLPVGHYFALRRTVGTNITIVSATDQSFG